MAHITRKYFSFNHRSEVGYLEENKYHILKRTPHGFFEFVDVTLERSPENYISEQEFNSLIESLHLEKIGDGIYAKINHPWSVPKMSCAPELVDQSIDELHPDHLFSHGNTSDNFVRDTHQAVRQFDRWNPTTPGEERFKAMVEKIETEYREKTEDAYFISHKPLPSFHRPP